MKKRAILLAGGKGTRLKPYTALIPKPLVPVGEKAILEILIENLKKYGIMDITICLNHLAEIIMAYFGNGKKYGVKISYTIEDKPLSTIAPLKLIPRLPENFFVMNGDLLTDINFNDLFDYHISNKSIATVATYKRKVKIDFGVIEVCNKKNIATKFFEKPEYDFNVSMGVYVFNKKIMNYVPDNKSFGFDDLMLTLLKKNVKIKVYPYKGYWLDIGRPDDYEKAIEDVLKYEKIFDFGINK